MIIIKINKTAFRRFISSFVCIILIFSAGYGFAGCGKDNTEPGDPSDYDWTEYDSIALDFINLLFDGDYEAAASEFSSAMKTALPASALRKAWEDTSSKAGEYIEIAGIDHSLEKGYFICTVKIRYQNTGIASRIVLSADKLISGLYFSYIDLSETESAEGVTEIPVIVGEGGEYPLNGILSLPENVQGKIPAVVLVHGSGPSDMNESAYGIKVFKDIADYLASNGIAVLRYDKRTYAHASKIAEKYGSDSAGFTVYDETIEDALLAKELLSQYENIDPNRIYVIGHSLGGMLAPRIMTEGDFAGAVLLAGSPRSLLDIVYDQNLYFIGIGGYSEAEQKELLSQVESASEEYFGLSRVYIDEMDANPAEDYIMATDKPLLIMQGGKDFQVYPDADFGLYRKMAEKKSNITLKYYENLNHFFIDSVMENPTVDDYVPGSHMHGDPLRDISEWLKTVD